MAVEGLRLISVWVPTDQLALRMKALFVFFFFSLTLLSFILFSESYRRVTIPDELDDVVDDEEDEEWRQWGQKKTPVDEPLPDFSKMTSEEIQAEVIRAQTGPSFGFVKLRPGEARFREDVPLIAMKWSKVLRTGSIEGKFMAVDRNTIMFSMEKGHNTEELKAFILSQPEAYEMKIGNQVYQRPGDPPLEEVIEMLKQKKESSDDSKEPQPSKDEL